MFGPTSGETAARKNEEKSKTDGETKDAGSATALNTKASCRTDDTRANAGSVR